MNRITLITTLFFVGCGSSKSEPQEPAQPEGERDLLTVCVKAFERQFECTDDFIPALVDARIRVGALPEEAAHLATEEGGREKLIEMALEEWKVDGVEPKRTESCKRMVEVMKPEEGEELRKAGEQCLAEPDCKAFTVCMIRIIEKQLVKEPVPEPAPEEAAPAEAPPEGGADTE